MTTTIGAAWRAARDRLAAAAIDTASLDARLLAQSAFGMDALRLAMAENDPADADALQRLVDLTERRRAHEPVARILGEKEFYGLRLMLSPETLVPRPETEGVVDLALDALKGYAAPRVLDLGTGTGCIAIALLANLPRAHAVATDLSEKALETALTNAERHGVADRIDFRQGDWFSPVAAGERFEAIVSNPPYIARADIQTLDRDVRSYDPHLALDGGVDGLDPYRVLAHHAGRYLPKGGQVILEHGFDQAEAIALLFACHGFVGLVRHGDLGGRDRVLVATWPG